MRKGELYFAVPNALIDERETEVVRIFSQHGILPDLALVVALRRVHDRVIENNTANGFPHDGAHRMSAQN